MAMPAGLAGACSLPPPPRQRTDQTASSRRFGEYESGPLEFGLAAGTGSGAWPGWRQRDGAAHAARRRGDGGLPARCAQVSPRLDAAWRRGAGRRRCRQHLRGDRRGRPPGPPAHPQAAPGQSRRPRDRHRLRRPDRARDGPPPRTRPGPDFGPKRALRRHGNRHFRISFLITLIFLIAYAAFIFLVEGNYIYDVMYESFVSWNF